MTIYPSGFTTEFASNDQIRIGILPNLLVNLAIRRCMAQLPFTRNRYPMATVPKSTVPKFPPINRSHRLLLRSALCANEDALTAWQEWNADYGFSSLDEKSRDLLPLVHSNLKRAGAQSPWPQNLDHRGHLCQFFNRNRIRVMAGVVGLLSDAGIPCMALKGAALILAYYKELGLRPMGDFDILVPTEHGDQALNLLKKHHWKLGEKLVGKESEIATDTMPGVCLVNKDDAKCDLHWHLLHDCCFPDADLVFWDQATSLMCHGRKIWILSPTDMLLHICLHGSMRNGAPATRWIPDAVTIIRTSGSQIDWDRLLAEARTRSFVYILQHAFQAIDNVLEISIPQQFRKQLAETSVSVRERLEYGVRLRDKNYKLTLIGRWCQLGRYYPDRNSCWRLWNFPSFLIQVWHIRRFRDFFPYLFRASFMYCWRQLSIKRFNEENDEIKIS